jgi:putative transposase
LECDVNELDPTALFRLSVLGPVVARGPLSRGELKATLDELAEKDYDIPGSHRRTIAAKTLQEWLYAYRREGLEGLVPQYRCDRGSTKLSPEAQEFVLAAKRANPRRSMRMLRIMLEKAGLVQRGSVSRSAIHRFLARHGLSRPRGAPTELHERRSFAAERAGDIWYGDVLHGPRVLFDGRLRKSYLVTLMDDASRLITHSAFCLAETALEVEGVLKQAVLKRGVCYRLIVDNGAAYRSESLQGICARLGIQLIYCKPRQPQGKGKLERWHRTLRSQFLSEIELNEGPLPLDDLNARLWAYLEGIYHRAQHDGLMGQTPLDRYQEDLEHIRPLGPLAGQLDEIFQHRVERLVRKDGTISYHGRLFEVPYELVGKMVRITVDPHGRHAMTVENEEGKTIGALTPLDRLANRHRRRRTPQAETLIAPVPPSPRPVQTLLELACERHYQKVSSTEEKTDGDDTDAFTAKGI